MATSDNGGDHGRPLTRVQDAVYRTVTLRLLFHTELPQETNVGALQLHLCSALGRDLHGTALGHGAVRSLLDGWYIDAVLSFRDGEPAQGSEILGHGRLALLEGIVREGQRGRQLGASRALLRMQVGDSYTELDANAITSRFSSSH